MENKTLCFTGKRPKDLFGYNDRESYEKLRDNVADMIIYLYTQGYKKYITGGAQGFDQVCFDAVEKLKEIHPEVENIIFAPCHNQDSKWSEKGLFSKEEYKERLEKRFPDVPVILWDERLSTVAADRSLMEASVSAAKRKQVIDKMAAVHILQGYLNSVK